MFYSYPFNISLSMLLYELMLLFTLFLLFSFLPCFCFFILVFVFWQHIWSVMPMKPIELNESNWIERIVFPSLQRALYWLTFISWRLNPNHNDCLSHPNTSLHLNWYVIDVTKLKSCRQQPSYTSARMMPCARLCVCVCVSEQMHMNALLFSLFLSVP